MTESPNYHQRDRHTSNV